MTPGRAPTATAASTPPREGAPRRAPHVAVRRGISYSFALLSLASLPACIEVSLPICDPCGAPPSARPPASAEPTVYPPPPRDVVEIDALWRRDAVADAPDAGPRHDADASSADAAAVYNPCADLSRFYEDELRYENSGFGTRCVEPTVPPLPLKRCTLTEAEPVGVECASVLGRTVLLDAEGLPALYRDRAGAVRVLCTVAEIPATEAPDAPAGWFAFSDPPQASCREGIRFTPRGTPRHNAYLFLRCCESDAP